MTIELTNLADIDQAAVSQLSQELTTVLLEQYPDMDLTRGVLQDLLIRPHAALSGRDQETLRRYLDARSLLQLSTDPTLADTDLVDDVLSNFRLARFPGSAASGEVEIVVSASTTVTIPQGLVFSAGGQLFSADLVYSARAESVQVTTPNDRLLRPLSDGNFGFTISVTAIEAGAEGLVRRNALLVPETLPKNFVTAYATSDFVGGEIPDTTTELLSRLQEGIAARAPSNRVNMQAMLRNLPGFENILWTSIVGMSDSEMTRDQHSIFPVSSGGVVDWYVRTQERLLAKSMTMTARYAGIDESGNNLWVLVLDREAAAGLYDFRDIRRPGAVNVLGTLEIREVQWGVALQGDNFVPDIADNEEAAFSRYQTAVVTFVDNTVASALLTAGDTQEYDVGVSVMPLVAEIQDAISSYELQAHGSDVLIRAAVPCFVSISFIVEQQRNATPPNLDAVKNALAREVNRTPFIGRLFASTLHDVIHGHLDSSSSLGRISMSGRILAPNREVIRVQSSDLLEVPTGRHPQVSEKTVQFFLDPEDVKISVRSSIPIPA